MLAVPHVKIPGCHSRYSGEKVLRGAQCVEEQTISRMAAYIRLVRTSTHRNDMNTYLTAYDAFLNSMNLRRMNASRRDTTKIVAPFIVAATCQCATRWGVEREGRREGM